MASRGVNKVILLGNLGQDPEVRPMNNGEQVANFSIATSETWNDRNTGEPREKTEWHRCVAYRRLAEIIGQYVRKGSKVYIEGRLQTRSWQDKNNETRYTTEIIVDNLQMLDSKSGGSAPYNEPNQNNRSQNYAQNQNTAPMNQYQNNQQPTPPNNQNFGPDPDAVFEDDDIPF